MNVPLHAHTCPYEGALNSAHLSQTHQTHRIWSMPCAYSLNVQMQLKNIMKKLMNTRIPKQVPRIDLYLQSVTQTYDKHYTFNMSSFPSFSLWIACLCISSWICSILIASSGLWIVSCINLFVSSSLVLETRKRIQLKEFLCMKPTVISTNNHCKKY